MNKKNLLFLVLFLLAFMSFGQDCNTPIIVDLSSSANITRTITAKRKGDCCGDKNCVTFQIILNPASDLLNFEPKITGSSFYSIDCGPLLKSGTPVCLTGKTTVTITFCKPGAEGSEYTFTASTQVKGSEDLFLRQGCTGNISIEGLREADISWTSIYPGVQGEYNSYLSCTSGCSTTSVTPLAGAPPYIDYRVSGSGNCSGVKSDIIRVYTSPQCLFKSLCFQRKNRQSV